MKSKDIIIGMRVVPTQKTVGVPGTPTWRQASEVAKAVEAGQPFLYVCRWAKDEKCWELSATPESRFNVSFFNAKDFYLYTGENHEI